MKRVSEILIKDGMVYDGTLSEPYAADIHISGDRIMHMGRLRREDADVVINAKGLAVCPGFIDTHAHSDFTLVADPAAEGKICQGVTTEINGNCGMSAAPLYGKAFEKREDDLKELGITDRWHTFEEYFSVLMKSGTALNFATLAGHGTIRGSVAGYEDRVPNEYELDKMEAFTKKAIDEGAIGLSTGLIYPPGMYSRTEELVTLARLLREPGLIYASHMRSEGNMLEEAVEEVLRIGREAGVRVHISHIKTAGESNWGKADGIIDLLDRSRETGLHVTCDRYPYTASSTDLDSILPAWTFEGGNEEEIRRLQNEDDRGRIREALLQQAAPEGYWEKVIISSVSSEQNAWMEGKTVAAISRQSGKDEIDAILDMLVEEKLRVGAIFLSMSEENLRKFLSLPYCMIGSDSSARGFHGPTRRGKPHPRGFGTFPRLLGKYVRDEKLFPLQVGVHKATMLAAQTFRLKKRGQIARGMYADLVVFDPASVRDRASFERPFEKPEGIYYVLVNGVPAVWEGQSTGKRAGMILRGK